jgi:hypothetical protein
LLGALDRPIPESKRAIDEAFLMPIESAHTIEGGGMVAKRRGRKGLGSRALAGSSGCRRRPVGRDGAAKCRKFRPPTHAVIAFESRKWVDYESPAAKVPGQAHAYIFRDNGLTQVRIFDATDEQLKNIPNLPFAFGLILV